jgi:hypothetical protein
LEGEDYLVAAEENYLVTPEHHYLVAAGEDLLAEEEET